MLTDHGDPDGFVAASRRAFLSLREQCRMSATAGAGFWGRTVNPSVQELGQRYVRHAKCGRWRPALCSSTGHNGGLLGLSVRCEYLTHRQLLARTADSHERAGAAEHVDVQPNLQGQPRKNVAHGGSGGVVPRQGWGFGLVVPEGCGR